MKKILPKIYIGILSLVFVFAGVTATAQFGGGFSGSSPWLMEDSDSVNLRNSAWEIGSSATRLAKGWFTDVDISGILTFGGVIGPGGIDLDGNALIIDADGDTQLDSTTDDRIDIQLGPSGDNLQYSAGAFAFQEGTTINTTAGDLTLDPNGSDVIIPDNDAISLGGGADSRLYYDGTDTFMDLRAVGTGDLMIALAGSFPSPDPDAVHIWRGDAGSVAALASSQLILEDDALVYLSILTPNSVSPGILFGDPESNFAGFITYDHPNNAFAFGIDAVARLSMTVSAFAFQQATTISTTAGDLTITPTTNLDITTGDIVLGASDGATGAHTGLTLRATDHPGGTDTNSAGADLTIAPGVGTGSGDVGIIDFQLPDENAPGTGAQTRASRLTLDMVSSSVELTMSAAQALAISTVTGRLHFISGDGVVSVVTGSGAGDDFFINTNQLLVEGDTGEVGIGIADPTTALHVVGTITADGLTMGANENITLGAQTLDHDGTDFVFNDSLQVNGTITGSSSVTATNFTSDNADPADAGTIRLGNAELIEWEASPAGTDITLTVDSSEVMQISGALTIGGTLDLSNNGISNIGNANSDLSEQTWTHAFAGLSIMNVDSYGVSATQPGTLRMRHSMSGVLGNQTTMAAEDELGRFDFQGSNGTAFFTGARFVALATETWVDGAPDSLGSRLEFHTTDNGTATLDLRMTIDQNGNVGIGTATPISTLHVNGSLRVQNASTTLVSSSATTTFRMENDTGTQGSCIVAETPAGTTVYLTFTTTDVSVSTTSCE